MSLKLVQLQKKIRRIAVKETYTTLEEKLINLNKKMTNTNKAKDMLTKHISIKESYYSEKAKREHINNKPTKEQLAQLRYLCLLLFEPVRNNFGVPILVHIFRCPELNTALGGSPTSQHMKCEAIDFDDTLGGVTNSDIFYFIIENLDFDQIIWELGDAESPDWVHASNRINNQRANEKEITIYYIDNGEHKYKSFKTVEEFNNFKDKLYA